MKTEKIDWKESTCPICGKKFIPAPEHVYMLARPNPYARLKLTHPKM